MDGLEYLFSTPEERAVIRAAERAARLRLHEAMRNDHWLQRLQYWVDLETYKKAIGVEV